MSERLVIDSPREAYPSMNEDTTVSEVENDTRRHPVESILRFLVAFSALGVAAVATVASFVASYIYAYYILAFFVANWLVWLVALICVKRSSSSGEVEDLDKTPSHSSARRGAKRVATILLALVAPALTISALSLLARDYYTTHGDVAYVLLGLAESDASGEAMRLTVRSPSGTHFKVAYVNGGDTQETNLLGLGDDGIGSTELTGLSRGATYAYTVVFSGGENGEDTLADAPELTGSFTTLPATLAYSNTNATAVAATTDFSFVSTSCTMKDISWITQLVGYDKITDLAPDFALFLGDFIYADVPFGTGFGEDAAMFQSRYRHVFSDKAARRAFASQPFAFIYDDHEIRNNYDGGKATEEFTVAFEMWQQYLGNHNPPQPPSLPDTDTQIPLDECPSTHCTARDGVAYYHYSVGAVSFFVFDTRMFRSPENQDPEFIIGAQQLDAFTKWFNEDQGDFKFLVSPQPWTLNYEGGWDCCPDERDAVFDMIESSGQLGRVMLVSADQHLLGVYEVRPGLVEISASPLSALATGIEELQFVNSENDTVHFEESGFRTVFAEYTVSLNDGEGFVEVNLYAGGNDATYEMFAATTPFLFAGLFAVPLFTDGKIRRALALLGVVGFMVLLGVLVAANHLPLDDPYVAFKYSVPSGEFQKL